MAYPVRCLSPVTIVNIPRETAQRGARCLRDLDSSLVPAIVGSVQSDAIFRIVGCSTIGESVSVGMVPCRLAWNAGLPIGGAPRDGAEGNGDSMEADAR